MTEVQPTSPVVPEQPVPQPKLLDLSKDLYEGGKADETQIPQYVGVAKQKGLLSEKVDFTGGTLMTIYMATAAEAGRPDSPVKEIAFNNPGREGRVVLWDEEMEKAVTEGRVEAPQKSLLSEAPASRVDASAPAEVLDLRLTFSDNPEAMQQMANPAKAREYMTQVVAQLKDLKDRGVTTVRLTGIPMWMSEGAAFAAARMGMDRVIAYTLSKEVVVYDKSGELMGKIESKQPQDVSVDLAGREITDMETVRSGRVLQETLGVELARNKVELANLDLGKIKPEVALRIFDSIHSFSASLKLADVEVFQHLDFRSHDLVPKTKAQNPDLQPREARTPLTLDVHSTLEQAESDPAIAATELARQAVNTASELTFTNITTPQELAVAGKVAHAAHGLIEELSYKATPDAQPTVVKSWKATS